MKNFVHDIKVAVIDLDGTVYRGEKLIEGSDDGLREINDMDIDIFFLTNEATKRRYYYVKKLENLGLSLNIDTERIITSGSITAHYLSENYRNSEVFVIGEKELIEEIKDQGVKVIEKPENSEVLVVSMYKGFGYETLVSGLEALNNGAVFIATNTDPTVPDEEGQKPGTGTIVAAIEVMAGHQPLVMGKPSKFASDVIIKKGGVDPSDFLLIGDRIETDIKMGEKAGMNTALVLTGSSTKENIKNSKITPDFVLDSLSDISEIF